LNVRCGRVATVIKANWGLYWANPGTASSNPNGSFDFGQLLTDDLSRIEVQIPGEAG